jgi:hypothetical protein
MARTTLPIIAKRTIQGVVYINESICIDRKPKPLGTWYKSAADDATDAALEIQDGNKPT